MRLWTLVRAFFALAVLALTATPVDAGLRDRLQDRRDARQDRRAVRHDTGPASAGCGAAVSATGSAVAACGPKGCPAATNQLTPPFPLPMAPPPPGIKFP